MTREEAHDQYWRIAQRAATDATKWPLRSPPAETMDVDLVFRWADAPAHDELARWEGEGGA